MKSKNGILVFMGVVILFCILPVISLYPFDVLKVEIVQHFGLWLKLFGFLIVGGVIGYCLRKVADRKLQIWYIAVTVLYIAVIVIMSLLPYGMLAFGSFWDLYGFECGLSLLISLLVMLGYGGIIKLVQYLSGKEYDFNLNRCFLVMAGFTIILWHIDYWVNGIDGFFAYNIALLHVARIFGVVVTGVVAGRMLRK